jgi:hypothetical protein
MSNPLIGFINISIVDHPNNSRPIIKPARSKIYRLSRGDYLNSRFADRLIIFFLWDESIVR